MESFQSEIGPDSSTLPADLRLNQQREQLVQIVNMLMGLLKGLGYDFESGTVIVREEADSAFSVEQEKE